VGLLRTLLAFPVAAPAGGALWVAKKIHEAAVAELHDPASIRRALADLEAALERGEITEEAFEEVEWVLLTRLSEAQT